MTKLFITAVALSAALSLALLHSPDRRNPGFLPPKVSLIRPPDGGIQAQAVVDDAGTMHMVYIKGANPGAADLFYVRKKKGEDRFSEPIRVNSVPNKVCAVGTVRGGQIAIGRNGRVHVVWNGLGSDYARLNDSGTAFEPQRNMMTKSRFADGGCTVAADKAGNVVVMFHGAPLTEQGEDKRRVLICRSSDDGATFTKEEPAWDNPTGVCPCCSMRAFFDHKGTLYALYRSAAERVNRDIYLLESKDKGRTFAGSLIHPWKVPG